MTLLIFSLLLAYLAGAFTVLVVSWCVAGARADEALERANVGATRRIHAYEMTQRLRR